MPQIAEKSVLVHWYYSVSEWEEFAKKAKKNIDKDILIHAGLIWMLGALVLYFWLGTPVLSMIISANIAVVYGVVRYYFRTWVTKWRGDSVPEIIIADGTAIVNGKTIIFQGKGKHLRNVNLKESNSVNIIEITFERQTRKGAFFEEIIIPVPRGKLREAMELVECLNLRRDVLSLFN